MRPLYIFDLDGTLALIGHRRHFVECNRKDRDWPAFFAACDQDVPNLPVIRTMEYILEFADVWVWSGRSNEVADKTVDWLTRHTCFVPSEIKSGVLTMRQQGDYTPDDVLKKQWLDGMLVDDRQRLVACFDDRDRVVKMYRDAGVTCFQVASGAF